MDPRYADAVQYIQDHLAQGFTEQQIRDHFLQSGWPAESIDSAFTYSQQHAAGANTPTPEPQTQPTESVSPPDLSPESSESSAQAIIVGSSPESEAAVAPAATEPTQPSLTDAPQKYHVFQAIGDFFRTLAFNPKTFIGTTIVGLIAAAVVVLLPPLLISRILVSSDSGSIFTILIWGNLLLVLATTSLAATIIECLVSITTADAHAQRKSSVGQVVSEARGRLLKVFLVNTLSSLIMYGPLVVAYIVLIFSAFAALDGSGGMSSFFGLLIIYPFIALLWLLIFGLRVSLSQQVAIFEPEISVIGSLKRSSFLLKHGGQWFVFKAALLLILVLLVLSYVTQNSSGYQGASILSGSSSVVASILAVFIGIIVQGVLTLLYFNLAAVRGVRG